MPHHPYSPDLIRATIFWFPWMENILKGKCFVDVGEVKQKMAEAIKASK